MDNLIKNSLNGIPVSDFLIIDVHAHIGYSCAYNTTFDGSAEALIKTMDRIGIKKMFISSFDAISKFTRTGNLQVLEVMKKYPDRLLGYVFVETDEPENTVFELEWALENGFSGIKIHSTRGEPIINYESENYRLLFEFANMHKMKILTHTYGWELPGMEKLFEKYSDIQFILAHAGAQNKENYVKMATTFPNVWLETCLAGCYRGLIEYFVEAGLADRLLWGSDSGYYAAEHQFGRVAFANISETDKIKILGSNAIKLFDLKD